MKSVLCLLFMGLNFFVSIAQTSSIHPLSIGDTVPDIILRPLVNYKTSTAKLSDFRGKLVILDFWSTWCSSCIAAMPKMEHLQNDFGDSIQILLINPWETETAIRSRIARMEKYKQGIGLSALPTVYGDSIWRKVFPHTSVPHHVWIDSKGKVIAITNGHNATKEHISKALNGESLHLTVKKDLKAFGYDPRKEGLFKIGNRSLISDFYSGFMKYNSGFGGGSAAFVDSSTTSYNRIWLNTPILSLFESAFAEEGKIIRTLLLTKDKNAFIRPRDRNKLDAWYKENLYSYQISLPQRQKNRVAEIMRQDLNLYFEMEKGIVGVIQTREINTYVLTITKKGMLRSKGLPYSYHNYGDSLFQYTNIPFYSISNGLRNYLEDMSKPLAFLDETGFSANVDMALSGNLHDLQNVQKQLKKYGLEIREEKRKLEVLVINDR